jgi:hypothetical protein
MPGIDFAALRRQLQLAQVLELRDFVPTVPWGAPVRGPCLGHGSRTPRSRVLAAHRERHGWHCCRCGAGGNALDWGVAVTRQPVYAAALDLCRRLHREVPHRAFGRRPLSRSPPAACIHPGPCRRARGLTEARQGRTRRRELRT